MKFKESSIYIKAPHFNQVGQSIGYSLKVTRDEISHGLPMRLFRYASKRMEEAGFGSILEGATVEIYTMDGDRHTADRSYCVRFTTAKGGYVELVGILTSHGWPSVDHDFAIGND